jgi:RIO-like serine/threonine protein kinase
MAIADSVTVSIAADTRGILREIFLLMRELKFVSLGSMEEAAGMRRTSSNVSPSVLILLE